jgi:hypothetical protein
MRRSEVATASIHMDGHELEELYLDLREARYRVQFGANRVVRKGAEIIDRQMTLDATGHLGNWFGIPGTEYATPLEEHVSHEMLSAREAEIGIENKGAGKLAHIIGFGSIHNAPAYDPFAGPRARIPQILEDFADMGERSVLGDRE